MNELINEHTEHKNILVILISQYNDLIAFLTSTLLELT